MDTVASFRDSAMLAHVLADLQQGRPETLDHLLSCRGGILDSLLLKAALAGIVAYGAKALIREKQ